MATVIFRGDAAANKKIVTITIGTYDVTTTYSVTMNGKTVSVLGQGGSATTTAAALYQALIASTYPEFTEIEWYNSSSASITATHTEAGVTFDLITADTGGTGTISDTVTQAASGPSDLSITSNYSTGALPGGGDTLVFENLTNGLLYGLTALSGIALARVVFKNINAPIGLPKWNPKGYWEYRDTYLQLQATVIDFDCPNCQLGRIDNQSTACTWTVTNTGQSSSPPLETLLIKNVNAASILNANGGSVAVAGQAGEVSTFSVINQGYNTQPSSDSYIRTSSGVTLANINRIGGVMACEAGISGTLSIKEGCGDMTIYDGAFPTVNHFGKGSSIFYLSDGTITTLTLGGGAKFDSNRNQVGFTITNAVQAYEAAEFYDKSRKATWAGIKANGCGYQQLIVDRGESRTWTDS